MKVDLLSSTLQLAVNALRYKAHKETVELQVPTDCPEWAAADDIEKVLGRSLTSDDMLYACNAMKERGGSFARTIAEAWIRGDSQNRMRVLDAFYDLFLRYAPEREV